MADSWVGTDPAPEGWKSPPLRLDLGAYTLSRVVLAPILAAMAPSSGMCRTTSRAAHASE